MAHLFFSYARKDRERLEPFCNCLEYELERCLWIDRKDIPDKALWMEEIEKGITTSDGVIFAVTANFVDPEREVIHKREIPWSYQHFKDRNNVHLYPILFDDVELPELLKTPYITHLIDARDGDMKRVYAAFKAVVRPEPPGSRPFLVAWPRLSNFKGRDQQLIELHRKLMGDGQVGVKTTGLQGMGGIGKTQLAVEYAYCYQSCYTGGVYWLNAGADWRKEVVAVADRLGLTPIDTSDTDRDKQMTLAFQKYLAGQGKDALIVLDNVDDPAQVIKREIAPKLTVADLCEQTRTRLLLTTRVQTLPTGFESVSVNVLSPPDARTVLLDAWVGSERTDQPDITGLDAIAQALGYLPLALGWIEAALRQLPDTSPNQLLRELKQRGLDDLIHELQTGDIDLGTPEYHDRLIASILDWQLGQLKSADSPTLLALTAVFGEAAVVPLERLRLLMGLPEIGVVKPFPKAVKDLQAYSLVETLSEGSAFRLHPLTQVYVNTKLDCASRLTEAVPRLVASYREPATLDAQTRTRGFAAVTEDLIATQRLLTVVDGDLETLSRLLTLEEPHLSLLQDTLQTGYVIQQVRERAYHESDDGLQAACERWLTGKLHMYHKGLRYPTSKALLRTLSLYTNVVTGAIELKNGRILSWAGGILGNTDNTLRLWSQQGTLLTVLEGHIDIIKGAIELKDGRILSWANDKTLRLWSPQGIPLTVLEGHIGTIHGGIELKDGRILSWANDKILHLWSQQGTLLTLLEGQIAIIKGAIELKDGRILSWANDKTLHLWSPQGTPLTILEGHTGTINGVIELKDGRILSWASDKLLLLWSRQGTLITVLKGHTGTINGVIELKDGRILSWGGDIFNTSDNTLRLWSQHGTLITILEGYIGIIKGAIELKDGRILSWANDKTLHLWSPQGTPLTILEGHTGTIKGAIELKDGHILSWANDKTLRLWSPQSDFTPGQAHTSGVKGAIELKDGRILSWANDKTLRLWSPQGIPLTVLEGHIDIIKGAIELKDGRILSWANETLPRLWSPQGTLLTVLEGHTGIIRGVIELKDGRILSWADNKRLRLWSPQGTPLIVLEGHIGIVKGAIELKDGRILSWAEDKTLRLWSPQGTPLIVLEGHIGIIKGAIELKDGRILSWTGEVSGSDDYTLRLWSPQGTPLTVLEEHTGTINKVIELKDGRILSWGGILGSNDKTLRLWSQWGISLTVLEGHSRIVTGAIELKDGRILSWASDKMLLLWSRQGTLLTVLNRHTSIVVGAIELKDGRILSWANDWELMLWSKEGNFLAAYASDTDISCCIVTKDEHFVVGDNRGCVLFLQLGETMMEHK